MAPNLLDRKQATYSGGMGMEFEAFSGGRTTRLIGHSVGVIGTIMAADWIIGTVYRPLMEVIPLEPEAMRHLGAGFTGIVLMLWGTALVAKRRAPTRGRARRR